MQPSNFEEVIRRITSQDTRYHEEAYLFIREALDFTQRRLSQPRKADPQHVSGKELLLGVRDYALAQFGPMAKTVLNSWGIQQCEDIGELVFNMVDGALLNKTESDSREDFKGGYEFDDAFCRPFRPGQKGAVPKPTETKAGQP